ncbi:MAG: hypothetical protein IKC64_04235, partial [Clostridia bacterium]|nr:hypothetical protein [Clostridia bacterium]
MIDINNIEQLKRTATDCYFRSVDIKALVDGLNSVVTLLNQPVMQSLEDKSSAERLSQPIRQFLTENKTALRVLAHRIKLKVKVLKYVTRGYLESAYQEIIEYAKEVVADSERGNYPKTALLAKNVTAYMEKVYAIMFDAESHQNRVFDSEGNSVITSIEQGQSVKTIFDAKIAQASMLESGVNLFGEQVAFISVRDAVVADLKEVSNSIGSQVARMAKQKESELIKKSAVEVENRFDDYEYYPVIADDRRANAVVICTPIRDEFLLYAYFSGKSNPAGISIVDLSKVNSGALGGILG